MKIAGISRWEGDDAAAALARVVAESPRRAGRFAELALIGAVQHTNGIELPPDTAIVLASHQGNRRQAEALVHAVAHERTAPMPFAFIASQSGAACQVVAAQLRVNGTALCISSTCAPFERALMFAGALLRSGDAPLALVGWVEESANGAGGSSYWLRLQAHGSPPLLPLSVVEVGAERARHLAANTAIDVDADSATALGAPHAVDEAEMARRLDMCWSSGCSYRRLRALGHERYAVLALGT